MIQQTDHRLAIENALRSIGAPQDVAKARQEGHAACAGKVFDHLKQLCEHGAA